MPRIIAYIMALSLALTCAAAEAASDLPRYDLRVYLNTKAARMTGRARIELPTESEILIHTLWIKPITVTINGKEQTLSADSNTIKAKGLVEIAYEASFSKGGPDGTSPINSGVVAGGAITPLGASLTSGWYPEIVGADTAYYSLSAEVPGGLTAVSEADSISSATSIDGDTVYAFEFPHPREGMTLIVGRYEVNSRQIGGTEVLTYFSADDASLADDYIQSAGEFIERYSALLGPYPYKRFAVVENFLQSGYSLPTYTLLGDSVIRLPFIRHTSLGHEILHQWFGNSVYPSHERLGGWTEGITTYLADYQFEADKGEGGRARRNMLTNYMAYVQPDKEITVAEFAGRTDYATRAVGYDKAAMVFHMLKGEIGEKAFYESLRAFVRDRKFSTASWEDIRTEAERAVGHDLRWFFTQWLSRKAAPDIGIEDLRVIYRKDAIPHVAFYTTLQGDAYRLKLPVEIALTGGGSVRSTVEITKAREHFEIPIYNGTAVSVAFDPDYEVMRILWASEYAPVISRLMGDEHKILVAGADAKYMPLKTALAAAGFTIKDESEIKDDEIMNSSLLIADPGGPTVMRLFARPATAPEDPEVLRVEVRDHPMNPSAHVVAVMSGLLTANSIESVSKKLLHYGKYSTLEFKGETNTLKTAIDPPRGMRGSLVEDVVGVRPGGALPLTGIIDAIADKPVIYVGEGHTSYEDHRVQLDVVRRLHEQGHVFAIGMEMFQTPYQSDLDDYIAGKTEEPEMLRGTEYFKRWGYDFNNYREVLLYARANHIPVVALNVKKEIVDAVSKGGLDALSAEDRATLPADMDMAVPGYRERIHDIFEMHRSEGNAPRNFDNFYQSQVIWDEVMARSIANYIDAHPESQMVVICGQGHVEFGSGIPGRAARRTGKAYATLINSAERSLKPGIADYVIFSPQIEPPFSAKLVVYLDETKEPATTGIKIKDFGQNSPAERAGLQKGDVIVSIDGTPMKSVDDLKILLMDKQAGDKVHVKFTREGFFLFGPKEMEADIEF